MNTDGNIAALNEYQDKIDSEEKVLAFACDGENFSDLMVNAYTKDESHEILEELVLLAGIGEMERVNERLGDMLHKIESFDNAKEVMEL